MGIKRENNFLFNCRLIKHSKAQGMTLIELLVVISIISILVVALGFSFQGWVGSYKVESQIKEVYNDLMDARVRAMQRNRAHFVVFNTNNYQVFEDANENESYDGDDTKIASFREPKTLQYLSLWNGTITMNRRGLISPNTTTIRFNLGTNNPDYDCLVLLDTRIYMGRDNGTSCQIR